MATSTPQASQAWHNALKLRKHLVKQLEKIKATSTAGLDISQLENADSILEKFRLACVQTIFLDFEFAVAENTEESLWALHTSINSEYRRILSRLKQSSQAVERRKTEKLYNNFLKIAQKFYKGYIQRLSARYDIPELKRAARGIDAEQMTAQDVISPVPSPLSGKVLKSCHATLIRLGDLARYRVQAKHKGSGYDMAMTYYSLAHQLIPQSGFAFHQMGIVSLDQGNDLDVVYHFYRAWAIMYPHPNAKPNLEMEFRSLQQPSSSKSKQGSVPQDAFVMWFVRLHALFYKGEAAAKHKELEDEVIHRLQMAARTGSSGNVILKMGIINMAAQHIAALKCSENESAASTQFYKYIMRFNARFLLTICSVLEAELRETVSGRTEAASEGERDGLSSITESLLPALRIYGMWLAASRLEVFNDKEPDTTAIATMTQTIGRVFTQLCVETYDRENLLSCPYLLAEDLDILGFLPLSGTQVPEACRAFCLENGHLKSHLFSQEQRLPPASEAMSRILDILRCAYFLAEDADVPLTCQIVDNWLVFESQPGEDEGKSKQAALPAFARQAQEVDSAAPERGQGSRFSSIKAREGQALPSRGQRADAQQPSPRNESDVGDAENTVINMLAPFLKPPTPDLQNAKNDNQESSYGMHTATANELLGSFQTDPSPTRSISSGKFEPLPWGWFNTPKPAGDDGAAAHLNAAAAQRSPGMSPNGAASNTGRTEDPFYSPNMQPARQSAFQSGNRAASASTFEGSHRAQLLQSFAGGAARASPFSQWGEERNPQQGNRQHRSPPGLGISGDGVFPQSSSASVFSHPSSLYQGTPAANGAGMHYSLSADLAGGLGRADGAAGAYKDNNVRSPWAAQRSLQMENTTSSYDEAILRAAYQGRK